MENMETMNNNWIKVKESEFDDLPDTDAVYLIVGHTDKNNNIVFYTGQTNNIRIRAKQHWGNSEENTMIKNVIAKYRGAISLYYHLDHGNALDGHEKYLYEYFKPQAQKRAPEVEPKEIELPSNVSRGYINNKCFE